MRVLMAGGGTAGHTSPLLATAAVLSAAGDEICCLGTSRGLEVTLIPQAGYRLELVPAVPMPRKPSGDLAKLPVRLSRTVKAAKRVIDEFQPDVVVGFGGYVSVPAYLAARSRKVPIVVHEGNALAGMANRLGARMTSFVATSFPDTDIKHGTYVGLPIRREIAELDRDKLRTEARAFFGLQADVPTVVVTGGSQGARRLNLAMSDAAPALGQAGVQVLHAAGRIDEVSIQNSDQEVPYVVKEFIDRMDLAYAAGDLIVCRAGANTVTEVAAVGLPAVFVPLPIGNGEQALNAHPVVGAGGGVLIDDAAFTSAWVENVLIPMVQDPARLDAMASAASGLVHRDAAERLADMIHQAGASR